MYRSCGYLLPHGGSSWWVQQGTPHTPGGPAQRGHPAGGNELWQDLQLPPFSAPLPPVTLLSGLWIPIPNPIAPDLCSHCTWVYNLVTSVNHNQIQKTSNFEMKSISKSSNLPRVVFSWQIQPKWCTYHTKVLIKHDRNLGGSRLYTTSDQKGVDKKHGPKIRRRTSMGTHLIAKAEHDGGSNIKSVPISLEVTRASARDHIFLKEHHPSTANGQLGGSYKTSNARPNHHCIILLILHSHRHPFFNPNSNSLEFFCNFGSTPSLGLNQPLAIPLGASSPKMSTPPGAVNTFVTKVAPDREWILGSLWDKRIGENWRLKHHGKSHDKRFGCKIGGREENDESCNGNHSKWKLG